MTNDDFVHEKFSEKLRKNFREIGFTHKLTINNYSSLSNITLCLYLKFRIPTMHGQLIRIISQNTEYVETYCIDIYNPFQFACRKWFNRLN